MSHYIIFNNGTFDLTNHVFTDGCPDNDSSATFSVDYDYEEHPEYLDKVTEIINAIFPNLENKKNMLKAFSNCLVPSKLDNQIYFLFGAGNNGKTLLKDLAMLTLGDNICNCPHYCLKQALDTLYEKRGFFIGELNQENPFTLHHTGLLKELASRNISVFLTSNYSPQDLYLDAGLMRRCQLINFETKFVDEPDQNNPMERKRDIYLKNKLNDYKMSFMKLLIDSL